MSENENKKTATERLGDLENTVNSIIQAIAPFQSMASDVLGIKQAVSLLNNKLDSVIKVAVQSGVNLSDESINNVMVENNVKDLTAKVTDMVKSGLLAASNNVTNNSFVVINEASPDGTIVNPRMQFLVSALNHEETRNKLSGAKVGDSIPVGDQGATINVLESYDVVLPKAPEAAQAATGDATPSAPADTAPATDAAPATDSSDSSEPAAPAESPSSSSDSSLQSATDNA